MPKLLSPSQADLYKSEGYVFPLRAIDADEARRLELQVDALERRHDDPWLRAKIKPHLMMCWLNELMRNERILDAVEDVIGPDILVWVIGRFDKKPYQPGFVSWHQDSTYWGLSEPSVVTAWVALTPSRRDNGCLRVIPGSHQLGQMPHTDTMAAGNMLSRGQDVAVEVDESVAVDLELAPGEFSLHHTMLIHGSGPNPSDTRRLGIAIRYVAAHVRQTAGFKDSATLVRGEDRYGHFIPEPRPARDFDPDVIPFYDEITAAFRARKEAIAAQTQTRSS